MRSVDLKTIDPADVTDARSIVIDIEQPIHKRIKSYEQQTKNMYFLKVGKIIVKMAHSNTARTANDCFERLLKTY
jgi:hypothetical protein